MARGDEPQQIKGEKMKDPHLLRRRVILLDLRQDSYATEFLRNIYKTSQIVKLKINLYNDSEIMKNI